MNFDISVSKRTALKTLAGVAGVVALPSLAVRSCSPDMATSVSGEGDGQRRLNGPQTTGRTYRNLSEPTHTRLFEGDVAVPMRDGVTLRVDVYRPAEPGQYPVLVAASPYPRQIQDLGAPLGFIEAGCTDFFVPRGYVHIIASVRGTGGSGGTFGFFDGQERLDMYDLVEWAGTQNWSDGNVGMMGISYFAMTQLEAAVEQPPHLKAIFPVAGTADLYEGAMHHGLMSSSFVTPFLSMIGLNAPRTSDFWRSTPFDIIRRVMHLPIVHKKFETMNGEEAMAGIKFLLKFSHEPHPWDDLWRAIAIEHPLRDAWWEERNLLPLLHKINVPVYLGCDWDNVPLHLPSTFPTYEGLTNSPHVQVAMLGSHGLSWPWESLHVEALAWYDHWLKGKDTGILDGNPIRYILPEADGEWRSVDSWPIKDRTYRSLALRADGMLADEEGESGAMVFMSLGAGLNRPLASPTDPVSMLTWTSAPLESDFDMLGDIELQLDAVATATDTAWIALLQDVDPEGKVTNVTAGYLRASLREVDETHSRLGTPILPCSKAFSVPVGEIVHYRIPMVSNARRFKSGHQLRLVLTSDDQNPDIPAILHFRHASVGTSSLNTIGSSSRLMLPILPA